MSRYRKSRIIKEARPAPPPIPEAPAVPALARANTMTTPRSTMPQAIHQSSGRIPSRRVTDSAHNPHKQPFQSTNEKQASQTTSRPRETENERLRRKIKEFQDREELKRLALLKKEEEEREIQLRKAARESEVNKARRVEEENAKILAEQKRKDLERLQKELDAAVPGTAPAAPKVQAVAGPMLREKFSFFSRKKNAAKDTPPQTPKSSSGPTSTISSKSTDPQRVPEKVCKEELPKNIEKQVRVELPKRVEKPLEPELPKAIGQGGGGIVPQTDAPISASNAGERVSEQIS
jgi:hypothetical protein